MSTDPFEQEEMNLRGEEEGRDEMERWAVESSGLDLEEVGAGEVPCLPELEVTEVFCGGGYERKDGVKEEEGQMEMELEMREMETTSTTGAKELIPQPSSSFLSDVPLTQTGEASLVEESESIRGFRAEVNLPMLSSPRIPDSQITQVLVAQSSIDSIASISASSTVTKLVEHELGEIQSSHASTNYESPLPAPLISTSPPPPPSDPSSSAVTPTQLDFDHLQRIVSPIPNTPPHSHSHSRSAFFQRNSGKEEEESPDPLRIGPVVCSDTTPSRASSVDIPPAARVKKIGKAKEKEKGRKFKGASLKGKGKGKEGVGASILEEGGTREASTAVARGIKAQGKVAVWIESTGVNHTENPASSSTSTDVTWSNADDEIPSSSLPNLTPTQMQFEVPSSSLPNLTPTQFQPPPSSSLPALTPTQFNAKPLDTSSPSSDTTIPRRLHRAAVKPPIVESSQNTRTSQAFDRTSSLVFEDRNESERVLLKRKLKPSSASSRESTSPNGVEQGRDYGFELVVTTKSASPTESNNGKTLSRTTKVSKRSLVPSPAIEGSANKKLRKASLPVPSISVIVKSDLKAKVSQPRNQDESSSELSALDSSPVEQSKQSKNKKRPRRIVKSPIVELTSQADTLEEWVDGAKSQGIGGQSDREESSSDSESEEEIEVKRKASPKKRKKVAVKKEKVVVDKKVVVKKQVVAKPLSKMKIASAVKSLHEDEAVVHRPLVKTLSSVTMDSASDETSEKRAQGWNLNSMDKLVWVLVKERFWWPADIVSPLRTTRPLQLALLLDTKETITIISDETLEIDPTHLTLLSFRSVNSRVRFDKGNFVDASLHSPESMIPSKEAFEDVFGRSIRIEVEREREEAGGSEGEEESATLGEEVVKEVELEVEEEDELLRDEGESEGFVFPFKAIARSKTVWWAAEITEYQPPPKVGRTKLGKFKVEWGTGGVDWLPLKDILTPKDPKFFTVKLGETKLQLSEGYLAELAAFVPSQTTTLQDIIDDNYLKAKSWNSSFFEGGKSREMLVQQARFGELTPDQVEILQDAILEWAEGRDRKDGVRPIGCSQYEGLGERLRSRYAGDVLLPLVCYLLVISESNYMEAAQEGLETMRETSGSIEEITKDAILEEAFRLAEQEFDRGSTVKWAVTVRGARSMAGRVTKK